MFTGEVQRRKMCDNDCSEGPIQFEEYDLLGSDAVRFGRSRPTSLSDVACILRVEE
jgi:hypothetical protein